MSGPDTGGRGAAGGRAPRLLFGSYHCYLDPSSGAALATRDVLELLAGRGWQCRVLCGPHLDFEGPESLPQLLSDQGTPFEVRPGSPRRAATPCSARPSRCRSTGAGRGRG